MPPKAISRWLAGLAVVALFVTAGNGRARAASGPAFHAGAIGGIVRPMGVVAGGTTAGGRGAASELLGAASGSSGTSPGGGTPPLVYGGGPLMHGVTTDVIAWGPSGHTFPSGYVSGFEQYLADMRTGLGLSSNISSIARQYVDSSGPALSSLTNAAAITDTDPYPASGCSVAGAAVCLTENQILSELAGVISADALTVDVNHSYIVLLPQGIDTCTDSGASNCENETFCGYHTSVTIGSATTTFTLLPYTQSSFSNSRGTCAATTGPAAISPALMGLDSVGAHELLESVTDPEPGSGYMDSTSEEIGDECSWTWGPLASATGGGSYNQLVNGNQYLIQEMWSNQTNSCGQGAASTAQVAITGGASPVAGTATSFSATLSGDSSAATAYEWSYRAPNGSIATNVASGPTPQITLSSAGGYTVWVAVSDASGGMVTGVSHVTVAAATTPTAGFSYSTQTSVPVRGGAVSFLSSSTPSGSQSITSTSWTFGDGATASGTSVSHTYASAGTYTVTVKVTQTGGQSSQSSQSISVRNPPSATIGWSPSSPVAGSSLSFSAGAVAGAGSISAYAWSFGDAASSTASAPSHTYAAAGTRTVTLTVTQSDGLKTTVSRSITVAAPPQPPTVSFSDSTATPVPTPGSQVSFTSVATPGAGAITAYRWTFGDGGASTAADPPHTYATAGSYTVTLTVTQTGGLTAATSATVTVSARPTVDFTWSARAPYPHSAIPFTATVSPGAGSISSYSWSFGDGGSSSAAAPFHSYASTGSFAVTLTVTQTDGLSMSLKRTVTIMAAPRASKSSSGTTSGRTPSPGGSWSVGGQRTAPSSWLLQSIQAADSSTRIGSLLRRNGSSTMLAAPRISGQLVVSWSVTLHHRTVVIATSTGYVLAGVTPNLTLRLTHAGRVLLSRQRRIKVSALATFRTAGGSSSARRRLTLTR